MKPAEEEAYTELYEVLYHSVVNLSTLKGRKVIIVLSDGVNFPREDNPFFPDRYGMEGAIEAANREGVSIFTIGLSPKADNESLGRIARETGGAHFTTYSPEKISKLYALIRDQILNEYLLTYAAGMRPADVKFVIVEHLPRASIDVLRSERRYFSETIFGYPQQKLRFGMFMTLPGALILLWLLSMIKFEKKSEMPSLDVYQGRGGGRRIQTLVISPGKKTVTIGAGKTEDLTITGDRKVASTVVKIEKKKGAYTVVSSGGADASVTVNNRTVKTKMLKSGDIIKVGDTTVVFDGGTVSREK
jgi:hypothetical protein